MPRTPRTQLGKWLRTLRAERDERLVDMAQNLRMKPSYLSGIELGSRPVPANFGDRVAYAYQMNRAERASLRRAILGSIELVSVREEEVVPHFGDVVRGVTRVIVDMTEKQLTELRNAIEAGTGVIVSAAPGRDLPLPVMSPAEERTFRQGEFEPA